MILALDTTAAFGSVALVDDGGVKDELLLQAPDGFGHVLFPRLQELLDRNGITIHAIDCFASAAGPGSFTGVRVGLAAVKGLAEACGKPAVAVSNLQAIACFGSAPIRAAILDARRGEVYVAVYNQSLEVVIPEQVLPFPAFLDLAPPHAEFLGIDLTFYPLEGRQVTTVPRALAAAIGRIAWERYKKGEARDPAALDANYVRRSDAELFWRES